MDGGGFTEDLIAEGSLAHCQEGSLDGGDVSFVHSLKRGKEFLGHLDLVSEGSMRVISIVEGGEGGLIDDLLPERKVRRFIGVEFVQLLYSSRG